MMMGVIEHHKNRPMNPKSVCVPYELYLQRGMEDGHDVQDWLQTEQEIRQRVALGDG